MTSDVNPVYVDIDKKKMYDYVIAGDSVDKKCRPSNQREDWGMHSLKCTYYTYFILKNWVDVSILSDKLSFCNLFNISINFTKWW